MIGWREHLGFSLLFLCKGLKEISSCVQGPLLSAHKKGQIEKKNIWWTEVMEPPFKKNPGYAFAPDSFLKIYWERWETILGLSLLHGYRLTFCEPGRCNTGNVKRTHVSLCKILQNLYFISKSVTCFLQYNPLNKPSSWNSKKCV